MLGPNLQTPADHDLISVSLALVCYPRRMVKPVCVSLLLLVCACSDPGGVSASGADTDTGGADAGCDTEECVCEAPRAVCGGACVDTRNHALHCGACDRACPTGVACRAGACDDCEGADCCTEGTTLCDGVCVDTQGDSEHCGGCDTPCAGTCQMGVCLDGGCDGELCDGACVDTRSDGEHCGGCGQACPDGATCVEAACACGDGEALCGDDCAVLASDNLHCGDCDNACDDDSSCEGGECELLVDPRQPSGHLGTLFWAAELDNRDIYLNDPPTIDAPFGFVLVNPGQEDAHISVTDPDGDLEGASTEVYVYGAHDEFEQRVYTEIVGADGRIGDPVVGTLRDVAIPPGAMLQLPVGRYQVPDDANTFESLGWKIESDLPIAAFMFNPLCCDRSGSAGASLLVPSQAAGTRYVVASPPHAGRHPATLTVMAADARVGVTITLTDDRLWGGVLVPEPDANGVVRTPLRPGEVLNLETMRRDAPPEPDLSGSIVEADGPVLATAGHRCARLGGGACDHVEEQLIPSALLGTRHVIATAPGVSWVQFTADTDTVITLSAPPAELAAVGGGTCDAYTDGADITLPRATSCTLPTEVSLTATATSPVLIVTYQGGNKSMHQQLPVARWRHRYLAPVPMVGADAELLVSAHAGAVVMIDGEELSLEPLSDEFSVGRRTISPGPHEVSSDLPIGVAVVAQGTATGWSFPAGFGP